MRWQPRSAFGQLAVLLILVVAGVLGIALALLRAQTLRPGAEQIARMLSGEVLLSEALLRVTPAEQAATVLVPGMILAAEAAPQQALPLLPILTAVVEATQAQLGNEREVRVEMSQPPRIWIRLATPLNPWLGIPIGPFQWRVFEYSVLVLALAGVLVLLAAWWYARGLVRPLQRLALAAPALARGEMVSDLDQAGPREVRELATQLSAAAEAVQQAARERQLLLAGVSHDLRTPLARLQFALEMIPIDDAKLGQGMRQDIAEIDAIVEQFIAYARDGRDEPSREVAISALLQSVVAATGRATDWQISGVDALPTMQVKPLALKRALENLVANAMNYGAAPFVIKADVLPDAAVCIRLHDHGTQLSDNDLESLKQPFARGHAGQRHAGSGLGLAIVARVAQLHHGSLALRRHDQGGLEAELIIRKA